MGITIFLLVVATVMLIVTLMVTEARSLHKSVINGDVEGVRKALRKGVSVDTENRSGKTAVSIAIKKNNPQLVELLLSEGAHTDTPPIILAASSDSRDVAELLLSKGADVNTKDSSEWTALMHAVSNISQPTSELLISKGADVNYQTDTGITPLMVSTSTPGVELAELLLKNGADLYRKDVNGKTALAYAKESGEEGIVSLFNNYGALN